MHTSDSNFFLVHDARKADFAPYMCLAYRCPGRRRTTVGKEIRLLFLESPQFFKTAKERTKWINWFPVSSTVLCTDPSRKFANCTFKRCCELEHLKFRSQSLNEHKELEKKSPTPCFTLQLSPFHVEIQYKIY